MPLLNVDWRDLLVDASGNALGTLTNPIYTTAASGGTGNVVSTANSTTALLGAGATFTGTGEDVSGYALITVNLIADQVPGTNGIKLEFSSNNSNWDTIADDPGMDFGAASISHGLTFTVVPAAKYFRVVYTNGATPQTAFRLQTVYKTSGVPEVLRVYNSVNGSFQWVRSANSLTQNFGGGTQPGLVACIRNSSSNHDLIVTAKQANTAADGVGVAAMGPLTTKDGGTTWKALLGNADGSLPVGGFTPSAPTCTFTRPANVTAYTIGDEVGTSGTAPTTVTVGRANGYSGVIQGASVFYSSYSALVPSLVVLLFSATVTLAGDNAQLSLSDSDAQKMIGYIALTANQPTAYSAGAPTSAGGVYLTGQPTAPIHFVCGASEQTIYACLVTLNAFTPIANSETLTLTLQVEQN